MATTCPVAQAMRVLIQGPLVNIPHRILENVSRLVSRVQKVLWRRPRPMHSFWYEASGQPVLP
jgi:hypothetical protein